jgi:[ribosomal protein S18]-alanine N-acetyltransferase
MRTIFDAPTEKSFRTDVAKTLDANMINSEVKSSLIRPASSVDIPAIRTLEQLSPTAAHWKPEQYEHLVSASSEKTVLVIEDTSNPRVQGFLVARNSGGEWELENVVISPAKQRHGLGTLLLSEFLNHAARQGAAAIFLEVRESNLAARAFYLKFDFQQNGRRKSYYRDPDEDAILYRLQFT